MSVAGRAHDLASVAIGDDGFLALILGDGEIIQFHPLLLRDACPCTTCRRAATNERLVDPTTFDPALQVTNVAACGGPDAGEAIEVQFSDGHTSLLSVEWLADHADACGQSSEPAGDLTLWDASSLGDIHSATWRDAFGEDGSQPALSAWLDALVSVGVALVEDVPADEEHLVAAAHQIGQIQASNYGVTWQIEATLEPISEVESQRPLAVHTDLPYRALAPGLQLLLCVHADVKGGASTFVDGYAVAEHIRHHDRAAWDILTTVELTYPYVRTEIEHHGRAPIIGLGSDGRYDQIRRAPDLVGVPRVGPAQTPEFYRALGVWNMTVDDPSFEIQIRLKPGQMLAFNNHRLLHGRTAFALGSSGRRRLIGCYLALDEVHSRRRVLARQR